MESSMPGSLKPLKITCTSTDCSNNLHCFRLTKKLLSEGPNGRCRSCGIELINWSRVHRRDVSDAQYTFECLRFELIRHHFWHIDLSLKARNYAFRKGKALLRIAAFRQIGKLIGSPQHPLEGRQTPRESSPGANAIHYAQHATASCCRRCLSEWHNIPEERQVTDNEIAYLTDLAMLYITNRIPNLADQPCIVPKLRHVPQENPSLEESLAY